MGCGWGAEHIKLQRYAWPWQEYSWGDACHAAGWMTSQLLFGSQSAEEKQCRKAPITFNIHPRHSLISVNAETAQHLK